MTTARTAGIINRRPIGIAFLLTYWATVPKGVGNFFGIKAYSYRAILFCLLTLLFLVTLMEFENILSIENDLTE